MGKVFYLISFLASLDPTYQEAGDQSRRALLETPMMKEELVKLRNDAEKELHHYTGLRSDDLAYAAYMYPVFAGKLSTKPFKNFKYESKTRWVMRPELEYTFENKSSTIDLIILKEF